MVIFLLVIIGIIMLLVIFSNLNKDKRRQTLLKKAYFEEYQSHVRVYNDSLELINKTKNIETLKSRYEVINDQIVEMKRIEDMGFNFGDRSANEIKENLPRFINDRIVEMAEYEFSEIYQKKDAYSSIKLAINALNKVQLKLIDYRNSLMEGSSYNNSYKSIDNNINKIKEEVLIGQIKEFIDKAEKEAFKGNANKANDLYIDALFILKKADFSNETIAKIRKEIELKIEK